MLFNFVRKRCSKYVDNVGRVTYEYVLYKIKNVNEFRRSTVKQRSIYESYTAKEISKKWKIFFRPFWKISVT